MNLILSKLIQQFLLMCYTLRKDIYILPEFQNTAQIIKMKSFLQ